MSFAIIRNTKYKRENLKGIYRHNERKNKNYSNKNIEKVSRVKYAKWNRSAYNYDDNTSDLVLKDNINAGYNVAKRVSNIVNPDMIKSKKIFV